MSTEPNALHQDISFLRRMAEEGRSSPILGGAFLAAAGVIFGIACFVQWALILRGLYGPSVIVGLWGGAMLLFGLVWLLIFLHLRSQRAAVTGASTVAFSTSWLGIGIGITVACIGVWLTAAVSGQYAVMMVFSPMVFAFYGTAWIVSGVLAHRRWMYGAAAGAYIFTIALGLLSTSIFQLPAMGAALLLTLTVPGVLLMREKAL